MDNLDPISQSYEKLIVEWPGGIIEVMEIPVDHPAPVPRDFPVFVAISYGGTLIHVPVVPVGESA